MEKSSPAMDKRFYSVREASVYSGLSRRSIYQKIKDGDIRYYRAGGVQGKIVIDRQDIDDFVMANEFKSSDQIREILKEKKIQIK
ncbi:unnamed protein product [marine sediment metagenome]|uniref:Helix-turn-helix domain-containing protein n=1 Tax=marine sediment metagenome TaxID=412755 RepID=X1HVB8_9ZZZZ